MRNIFDDLLEELQRRQQEQDARREGRELPPRRRARDDGPGGPRSPGRRPPGGPDDGADEPVRPFGYTGRYARPLRIAAIVAGLSGGSSRRR